MHRIKTDVLVIGLGLAGLVAALTVRKQGLDVTAVCKTAASGGRSCTLTSNASFRGPVGNFTREEHRKVTMSTGEGLNEPVLAETLTAEAGDVPILKSFGVPIEERPRGYYTPGPLGVEGAAIVRPLVSYARQAGVRIVPGLMLWELAVEGGRAAGAWGIEVGSGEFVSIAAKAVILASGGAGAAYCRTTNPSCTTGDGYGMAYRAGLPLADMEFVQFYPVSSAEPGLAEKMIYPIAVDVAVLRNRDGEDIIARHRIEARPLAVQARDSLSRAICLEIHEGRGVNGAVQLDLTGAGDDGWCKGEMLFGGGRAAEIRFLMQRRYRIEEKPVLVLPTAHFFMGGIPVDVEGRTAIHGLLAAGEVTTGLHGANRLGGNALTEGMVFGRRAGLEASRIVRKAKSAPVTYEHNARTKELAAVLAGDKGEVVNLEGFRRKIRVLLWEKAGVLREQQALQEALDEISFLTRECRLTFNAQNAVEVTGAMEARNLAVVAEAVIRSALARTESRGSHYRLDYPGRNDAAWLKHVVVIKKNDGMGVESQAVGSLSAQKLKF